MAKTYLISSLAEKCCEILEASIKPQNVFAVLEQAVHFDEKELEEKSWDIVSRKTQECLNSEAFCDIGLHTLNALLKKKSLAVTEVELFKAVLKWTDSECARQGINIEEDKTARRRVLGDSVYDPGNVTAIWGYSGCSDALTLIVNKAVLFHGVRLFGDSGGSQYEVNFTVKDETVTGTYTSQQNDGVWSYDVMLSNPIPFLPNEEFTIIATIKGPTSCRGDNGKQSVKVDDIVVTFKKSDLSTNGTNTKKGQFFKTFLSER